MKLLLVLLVFTLSFLCEGQETTFKTFSVREGLAQSQVYSIVQGQNGYLWMGTQGGGLCKFNGNEFLNFTVKDGLSSNTINALLVINSKLYIGTNQGVTIFNMQTEEVEKIVPIKKVVKLIRKIGRSLYFLTDDEVYEVIEDYSISTPFLKLDLNDGKIQDLFLFENELFLITSVGLFIVDKGELSEVKTDAHSYFTKYINYKNSILLGSYGKGTGILIKNGAEIQYSNDVFSFLDDLIITELFLDSKNILWVGTQRKGLYRYDEKDKNWEHFGEKEGLSNDHVKCVIEDKWGQIWIGTSGGGVSRYSGSQF